MPELKLGTKYECFSCGTKFYDLGKSEPVCPKCGSNQKDAVKADTPAVASAARRKRKAEVKPVEPEVVDHDVPADEIVVEEEIETPEIIDDEAEEEVEDLDDEA